MSCADEKLSKYLTQTFTAHCNAMICQQVTLSGDAEWPKVADAVIEARGKGRQMLGQAAAGLARIPLVQGLMDGTIAPKVVTHRIPLLIRWIFQRGYTMRQPLLNVYIKMSYKSVRWRNRYLCAHACR